MQFTLYTDKTVKQCLTAISERMQDKETKARPAIDGWIDKSGSFTLTTTRIVKYKFVRTTRLRGVIEREGGVTIVSGSVPNGASTKQWAMILGAVSLIALTVVANGEGLLGLIVFLVGVASYIPLTGDYHSSDYLVKELKRTLKAKDTPPKDFSAE